MAILAGGAGTLLGGAGIDIPDGIVGDGMRAGAGTLIAGGGGI